MKQHGQRTLSLKREALASLSYDDLTGIVGGAALSRYDGKCTFDDSYLLCTRSCLVDGAAQ